MTNSSWTEQLKALLHSHMRAKKGDALFEKYQHAFEASFRDEYAAEVAFEDIQQMELPVIHLFWYDAFKYTKFIFLPIWIIFYKPGYPETSGESHEPRLH